MFDISSSISNVYTVFLQVQDYCVVEYKMEQLDTVFYVSMEDCKVLVVRMSL